MSRSTAILVGIASLLLLTWITVALRHQPIETDLVERVGRALSVHAISGLSVSAEGRDLTLSGETAARVDPEYVADIALGVWGVRAVDVEELTRPASMHDGKEPLQPRLESARISRLGGSVVNPMNAGTCQRTLARLASVSAIRFESGGASPMLESYPLLNDLAAVAYQCPETRLVIGGHTDSAGPLEFNLQLSQARAEAVEHFFYLAGIPAERMQVIAYGDSQPVASNASSEGRAANRRITFDVLPKQ